MNSDLSVALIGAVVGGAIALAGALVAIVEARSRAQTERRTSLTLSMFERYNDPVHLNSRIAADRCLKARPTVDGSPEPMQDTCSALVSSGDWEHVSRVRHFWSQLATLVKAGLVDTGLVRSLLRADIRYWRGVFEQRERSLPDEFQRWRSTWADLESCQ